jgi:hypothetical protein
MLVTHTRRDFELLRVRFTTAYIQLVKILEELENEEDFFLDNEKSRLEEAKFVCLCKEDLLFRLIQQMED